jgi:hypothetical protein
MSAVDEDRIVLVDDTDPGIIYIGNWTLGHGSEGSSGILGPEFNHTLHGTTISNDSSASYSFNGELTLC